MCVILPFAQQRFTPMDIVAWKAILADQCRRGLWQKAERVSNRDRDSILIWLPARKDPVLRLERDSQGIYRFSFHDGECWLEFRQAFEIADCLAHVVPVERLRTALRRAD